MSVQTLLAARWRNRLQSALLLIGMGLIWALLGWSLTGRDGMLVMLAGGVVAMLIGLRLAPRTMLVMYGAHPLSPERVPQLYRMLEVYAGRAGLTHVPTLYHLPSSMVSAFSTGSGEQAVIALSDGLLRTLSLRELSGVLAHELSHLRNHDTWVMSLADMVSRLTHFLSLFGQLLLLINLPLLLFTDYQVPWMLVILLILAPGLTALLQLALSRQREYDADAGAATISGDPLGLAAALVHLERLEASWLDHLFLPGRRVPEPSLLRTHPPTRERVRRLQAMASKGVKGQEWEEWRFSADGAAPLRRPRRSLTGLWY